MLFQTTAAHEELRAKIRSFAEEEIKPLAFLMDQNNEFPEEAVKKLGKLGWMGIPYPKEYGGAGLDALSYAIAVEELARVDGGAGVILSAHVSLGSWPIFAYGTEEQKKKYLVPLAKGEKIGAFVQKFWQITKTVLPVIVIHCRSSKCLLNVFRCLKIRSSHTHIINFHALCFQFHTSVIQGCKDFFSKSV